MENIFEDEQIMRFYKTKEVITAARQYFDCIEIYGGYNFEPFNADSPRLIIVCKPISYGF